ncbi:hypothetical protein C2E25_13755 [Geothermobacter hydrogeniphilus]|uniref:ABC-type transport system involved in multi-copper enzyme maturation, permease component n=1 Tax=Geothermobacter hydrogeniphilus TaxID=1969733 RepID=A0A2K2H7B2_9BACT|nr:hypothetical protein [Geothermobacter hydrogeniphilus]PNU19206.1 hypothetical protein C2E25_13755 [Geothermobacter hydrogeniphilus]
MTLLGATLKGIFRDRVFRGLLMVLVVFAAIPAVSTLSMRQVVSLCLTLCLSLSSLVLLVLALFLGGTVLWRDLDRRYCHALLSLPLSRERYLWERYAGIALFLGLSALVLGGMTWLVTSFVAAGYPPGRPILWTVVFGCIALDLLKCLLLVAFAFCFSAFSTSFFLPIFGTIAIYLVGGASQGVHDYLRSSAATDISLAVRRLADSLYYLLPNFSLFDIKLYAIYGLPLQTSQLLLSGGYFLVYTLLLLGLSGWIFARRQIP